jgi:membrane protein
MFEHHQQLIALKQWAHRFRLVRIVWRAFDAYHEHGCMFMTSALSFYAIISLIPLAALAFWALTVLIGSSETAQQYLAGLLNNYLLATTTSIVIDRAQALAGRSIAGFLGVWWSLLVFVWSGARFFELLQVTLSRAWGGNSERSFWRRKLVSVLAFLAAAMLGGLALALSASLTAFQLKDYELFGFSPSMLLVLALHILPVVFSILLFVFLYRFMPVVHVPWGIAFGTAIPVGIVWEVGKRLFTLIVVDSGIYYQIYGPMMSFILLMVWIYFSAALLLFGAEIGAAWQHDLEQAGADPQPAPAPAAESQV